MSNREGYYDFILSKSSLDTNPASTALKYDEGKSRVDLIDPDILVDLGNVLSFGAKKYNDNNWMKGLPYSKIYASLLRHLLAWFSGIDRDSESGLPHLAHAMACLMMLFSSSKRSIGTDDRQFKL